MQPITVHGRVHGRSESIFRPDLYLGCILRMSAQVKEGGKKGSKKDGVGGGLVCAHCKTVGEIDTMKRCGRCRRVCYCSVECQKLHWKGGGHKKVCGKKGGSGARGDGVPGASGGGSASLKHPCPICLDNEDDAGVRGMCCSCGQLFCGSCRKSLIQRGVTSCPTCRAVLDMSDKERFQLLQQLVARPTGRHTPVAQFDLGVCYAKGVGVAQDKAEAVRRYRLAAGQGDAKAQYNLGGHYGDGIGVAQDASEAVRWYRLAAGQGDATAQFKIGVSYANGAGVAQDASEAVRWYRLAAGQGDAKAQFALGGGYAEGTGAVQDDAEAVRWFRLAADQGHVHAQFIIGTCYDRGIGFIQDEAEAVRWYRLAADQGYADALTALTQLGM
jgi:hypothetical protein